jgi:hypothetical protein
MSCQPAGQPTSQVCMSCNYNSAWVEQLGGERAVRSLKPPGCFVWLACAAAWLADKGKMLLVGRIAAAPHSEVLVHGTQEVAQLGGEDLLDDGQGLARVPEDVLAAQKGAGVAKDPLLDGRRAIIDVFYLTI